MVRMLMLLCALAAAAPAPAGVVLVDFYMPTCQPCRQMDPVVSRLEREGRPVRRVDGTRDPELARRFGVHSYPTFLLLVDGEPRDRAVGLTSYERLAGMLDAAAPGPAAAHGATVSPVSTFASQAPAPGEAYDVGGDLGAAPPSPQRVATPVAEPAEAATLAATVRLRVNEPNTHAYGTGTLIDTRSGEALILTCGHLFRDVQGRPITNPAQVEVEVFEHGPAGPRVVDRVPALKIVGCDFQRDLALVSIRPTRAVRPTPLASLASARAGDAAMSVGCDEGADPSLRRTAITAVDRYQGTPNLTSTGAPVVGRSGGGLFNTQGELIGVCFAADTEGDEGLYTSLPAIHAHLDEVGLSSIYRQDPPAAYAQAEPTPSAVVPSSADGLEPVGPRPEPLIRGQDTQGTLTAGERLALGEVRRLAAESEVVVIVRPKDPAGRSEVFTLDTASPALIEAMRSLKAEPTLTR